MAKVESRFFDSAFELQENDARSIYARIQDSLKTGAWVTYSGNVTDDRTIENVCDVSQDRFGMHDSGFDSKNTLLEVDTSNGYMYITANQAQRFTQDYENCLQQGKNCKMQLKLVYAINLFNDFINTLTEKYYLASDVAPNDEAAYIGAAYKMGWNRSAVDELSKDIVKGNWEKFQVVVSRNHETLGSAAITTSLFPYALAIPTSEEHLPIIYRFNMASVQDTPWERYYTALVSHERTHSFIYQKTWHRLKERVTKGNVMFADIIAHKMKFIRDLLPTSKLKITREEVLRFLPNLRLPDAAWEQIESYPYDNLDRASSLTGKNEFLSMAIGETAIYSVQAKLNDRAKEMAEMAGNAYTHNILDKDQKINTWAIAFAYVLYKIAGSKEKMEDIEGGFAQVVKDLQADSDEEAIYAVQEYLMWKKIYGSALDILDPEEVKRYTETGQI